MVDRLIDRTGSHRYPLLIKRLLEEGVTRAPEQEIVRADRTHSTSRVLER